MNVSIVIPTLNEEENLPECLQNVKPQTSPRDEIVIVDGGSEDSTQQIATNHGAKVLEATGSSIGQARTIGVNHSSNPIIATLDADSLPPKGWLDTVKENFRSDPDLTVLWGTVIDKNGVPIRNLTGKFSTILGGASGNNTAFKKEDFDNLQKKYPDVNFLEDVAIIYRLSRHGKAKRDKSLRMVMNMDRRRYQTAPIIGLGATAAAVGHKMGGKWGKVAKGTSAGMVGTELTYESATDTPFHHDQVGATLLAISKTLNSDLSDHLLGAGLGMVLHHDMTEGISALPSTLQRNTK